MADMVKWDPGLTLVPNQTRAIVSPRRTHVSHVVFLFWLKIKRLRAESDPIVNYCQFIVNLLL